jgi:hypothetical protein
MVFILFLGDDLLHLLIVITSFVLLGISLFAYLRRPSSRYLLLFLAFFFLAISQTITFAEVFFLSDAMLTIPYVGLHVTHLLDFAMLLSFGLALTRYYPVNRQP